jgi:hypothetical protein
MKPIALVNMLATTRRTVIGATVYLTEDGQFFAETTVERTYKSKLVVDKKDLADAMEESLKGDHE